MIVRRTVAGFFGVPTMRALLSKRQRLYAIVCYLYPSLLQHSKIRFFAYLKYSNTLILCFHSLCTFNLLACKKRHYFTRSFNERVHLRYSVPTLFRKPLCLPAACRYVYIYMRHCIYNFSFLLPASGVPLPL